ncbi:MAG: DUF6361 family protein [Cypionkella sp.]|uniref:DUF6361 family protein n=1 Tax=Cypionkella sp. TaxID=2811411 RepID=UPI002ABA3064|nr:DUF6361 family protein [Cypionkella sp.]MDZ4312062.1 DUF6361 family protein [Cypionkella sp.]
MSFLAWIDFDQADRDRTRRIMDLFGTEESRDELGLGSIRDALADLMFPGTSVIQTRLRYMLFVPWIFRLAASRTGSAAARLDFTRGYEIRLIDALLAGGETTGIIGSEARAQLKRLPSDVYWAGLQRWGVRAEPGSRADCLSLPPDSPAWISGLPDMPDEMPPDPANLKPCDFILRSEEASFLKDRLVITASETLLTTLALSGWRPTYTEGKLDVSAVWLHSDRPNWSARNRGIVTQAESFARVMRGASLLYNLVLAEQSAAAQGAENSQWRDLVALYRQSLTDWQEDLRTLSISDWKLTELWTLAEDTSHRIAPLTMRFVGDWREIALRSVGAVADLSTARSLVEMREIRLKGSKSRLRNASALSRWNGASGAGLLTYRWSTVASHLGDLANVAG